jgi:uncharacterized protein with HEPN domain
MPSEADLIRIRHMAEAAREAIGFADGRTRAHLDTNRMLALAIVKAIEIVGEAASRVSDSAKAALPAVPWPDIVAMRHRLIHTYFDVNLDIVWGTVEVDLPPLAAALDDWLGRQVMVVLNDNGGLNALANPWLKNITLPSQFQGPRDVAFTVERTFRGRDDMFVVSPPALAVAKQLGFSGEYLSSTAPVRFLAALVRSSSG